MTPLRPCAICSAPIPPRKYQAETVRTCSPGCARDLAYRECPDLGGFAGRKLARLVGEIDS